MARGSKASSSQSNKNGNAGVDEVERKALRNAAEKGKSANAGRASRQPAQAKAPEQPARPPRIFDDRTKRDIIGVVIAVAAVVLLLMALIRPNGMVTGAASDGLHMLFGIGSYLVPVILAAVGVCMLLRNEDNSSLALRMGVGLTLIFVSFCAILSLFSGQLYTHDASRIFAATELTSRGGYLGMIIAYGLYNLLGFAISFVVMAGLAVAGAVIIGFSLSGALDKARNKGHDLRQRHEERVAQAQRDRELDKITALDSPGFMRLQPNPNVALRGLAGLEDEAASGLATRRLGPAANDDAPAAAAPTRQLGSRGSAGEEGADQQGAAMTRRLGGAQSPSTPSGPSGDQRRVVAQDSAVAGAASAARRFGDELVQGSGGAQAASAGQPAGESAPSSGRFARRDVMPRVPHDLSRPRRATQSISLQLQQANEPAAPQSGPLASSPDYYWPNDYAFDGRGVQVPGAFDDAGVWPDGSAASPAAYSHDETPDESFIGVAAQGASSASSGDLRPSAAGARDDARSAQPATAAARVVFPWEDDDATDAEVSAALAGVEQFAAASEARAATLRLDKPPSASAKPAVAQPDTRAAAPKTPAKASHSASAKTQTLKKAPAQPRQTGGEERGGFVLPNFNLIKRSPRGSATSDEDLSATAADLQTTMEDFGVMASVVGWVAGPTVTLFKVELPSGVRVSRVMGLQDDIALALAAPGVRIFAPIPGTNYVGIEVPNRSRQTVLLGDVLKEAKGPVLQIAIGKDVEGNCIISDLAKMPHLLIGGTTGSGKSVAINAMIMSILMRATPDEVRFIMVDPKRVEFTPYNGIPHLYVPVVNENKDAASALAWAVAEMERRLKVLSNAGVRNIGQYNEKVEQGFFDDEDDEDAEPTKKMCYIVIVIDELADLMMNVGKEVEISISRLAQLARAAGIHLIVATQRPSANVVTGLIKANITNRIAFNVASSIDSRVILDTPGAENLIGLGDMLYSKPEYSKPVRLQGCFVSESEIEAVVEHLKTQGEPEYHNEILQVNVIGMGSTMPDGSGGSSADDPLLWEAADIVVSSGLGSTSNIQRRLSVGYARAGRIMDMLEEKGIVGPPNGSKPREVLVDEMELESLKAFEAQDAADGF